MENATQLGAALFLSGGLLGMLACFASLVLTLKPALARRQTLQPQTQNLKALVTSHS